MAIRGVCFKWYDGFFLSMLAFSIVMVLLSWERYHLCKRPLHLWIVVDYGTISVFRLLMFADNWLSAGMGLDLAGQQRDGLFIGRVVVLSILYMVLYPFLWAWSITGSVWFKIAQTCLPEKNQKWGFLVWLIFSYCGLVCVAAYSVNKVLVDMIRLPASESATQEMRFMEDEETVHHARLYFSRTQTMIEGLPLFALKAVPSDSNDCPICLEEFNIGDEVRGLPCGHNFHVACIDKWLKLNIKCPRCRCCVFPNLNQITPLDPSRPSPHATQTQSYLSRMQTFLQPIPSENAAAPSDQNPNAANGSDVAPEVAENGGQVSEISHERAQ